jgi:superfamily II DNA helicase RecQ
MSRLEAEDLRNVITTQFSHCALYHSGLSKLEREQQHVQWLTTVNIMVATSAFTMGIDYPKVVSVFVFIGMYAVWELEQCAGRVRRDGEQGEFIVITSSPIMRKRMSRFGVDKKEDCSDLESFLFGKECRRALVGTLLDNVTKCCSDYISDSLPIVYCDTCEQERDSTSSVNIQNYFRGGYLINEVSSSQDIMTSEQGEYFNLIDE